jgi:hypothetical protein
MWRGGFSPLSSRTRTIPVNAVIEGKATAESPGAGWGAGRDGMASVLESRLVGKPLAAPDQGLLRPIRRMARRFFISPSGELT